MHWLKLLYTQEHERYGCCSVEREFSHRAHQIHPRRPNSAVLKDTGEGPRCNQRCAVYGYGLSPHQPHQGEQPEQLESESGGPT